MESQPGYSYKELGDNHEYGERLSSLKVSHYRGFGAEQTVKFAHPNGQPGSGLTIICGENNSGKSSIFHALMKFHDGGLFNGVWYTQPIIDDDEKDTTGATRLSVTTCDGSSDVLQYSKRRRFPTIYDHGTGFLRSYGLMFVRSDITWSSEGELQVEQDEHQQKYSIIGNKFGGHDGNFIALQDMYDKEIGNYLSALSGDKTRWRKFKRDLKYIIPEWKRIHIADEPENRYKIKVYGRSGQRYSADLLGGGYLRLLRVMVGIYGGQNNSDLVIDEPELYLQPFAQKRLMKLLVAVSVQRQVILITHSPHFIDWRSISYGAVVVHTHVDKQTKENRVVNITSKELQDVLKLTNDWHKPQLLDAVAKELFFTRAVVFTEGQEDVALLNQFALDRGIDLSFDWFGYGTGGAPNIRKFLALAKILSLSAAAIYDGDQPGEYEKALHEYGEISKIILLDKDDIRDKYDDFTNRKRLTKEGYFTGGGRVKRNSIGYLTKLIRSLNVCFADR